jgi:hypothetical protein
MRRAVLLAAILALVCSGMVAASQPPNPGGSRLVSGGGRIWEGEGPATATADIIFSGFTTRVGPGTGPEAFRCEWQVRFNRISVDWLEGRTVRTTGCDQVAQTVPEGTDGRVRCSYMPVDIDGDPYLLSMIVIDVGEPGRTDEVRFVLRDQRDTNPMASVYDTSWDFTPVAAARTELDAGNIQVWIQP